MITSADEYLSALFKIYENGNIPSLATLLPDTERIYNIDLNSRTVEAPEFLSVTDDHVSETVYFLVDRFFDNIDMSTTGCVIQYINANNEGRIYSVPFYDIETYHAYDKMLIPWCIEGEATKAAGEVTYSIRFFKIDPTGKYITFVSNTIPQKSKILQGMNILDGYIQVEVDAALFATGSNTYYTKNQKGEYVKATSYNPNETYYTLTDGYNYSTETLNAIYAELANLKRETQAYWYDASKRSAMDVD